MQTLEEMIAIELEGYYDDYVGKFDCDEHNSPELNSLETFDDARLQGAGFVMHFSNGTDVYVAVTTERPAADPEACPGCGCMPGDDVTKDCTHPEGCGYQRTASGQACDIPGPTPETLARTWNGERYNKL